MSVSARSVNDEGSKVQSKVKQVLSRSSNGAETADNYFAQKVKIVTHIIGLGLNNPKNTAKYSTQT